jgi:amino acid adenylation domain-containing protein
LSNEITTDLAGFRLSPQQEQLALAAPADRVRVAQCAGELPGAVEPDAVRAALERVIAHHESLRTTLRRRPGMRLPEQVIADGLPPDWQSEEHHADPSGLLDELLAEEAEVSFDPERGPVVRARLVRTPGSAQVLVLTVPSVLADASSLVTVFREIAGLVSAPNRNALLDEPLQYADYAEWRNELLAAGDQAALDGEAFWAGQELSRSPKVLFQCEPAVEGAREVRVVSIPLRREHVSRGAFGCGVSESVFLEACWHACIARLSGESDVVVAGGVTGRPHDELKDAVGPFEQALPIRTHIEPATLLAEVVDQVRRSRALAERWQEYARSALLQNVSERCALGFSSIDLAPAIAVRANADGCALRLCHVEGRAELHYDAAAVDLADAQQLASHLAEIVRSAGAEPTTIAVSDLSLMSADERALVVAAQPAPTEYPQDCIHHLFEERAAAAPERVAVVHAGSSLTYRELNERANRLAHHLRTLGVGRDVAVGLCTDRSTDTIVGLLAILKAGGGYVPLNFEHPPSRLAHQLEETGSPVLVTQTPLLERLGSLPGTAVCVDVELESESAANPAHVTMPDDLAYVMYTSGSTGLPKGVGVTHRNLLNYATAIMSKLELDATGSDATSFAAVSAISTDLGNTSVVPSLCFGGTLHLVPTDVSLNAGLFAAYMQEHPIDVLKITPSHLRALLADRDVATVLPRRRLVLGGEAATWELVDLLSGAAGDCRIFNHYGPTETTVGSCAFEVGTSAKRQSASVPVGRPLANTRTYVLDGRLEPVPVGVVGELFIGGTGVARGYVGQPEQTAERFLADPFAPEQGARMYRTGDRARVLRDGSLEFLGRIDDQVKIRGYRVEPREVEGVLLRHGAVRLAAVVVDSSGGEPRLVAYVVSDAAADALHAYLEEFVPEYMVPAEIARLAQLPLTPSGKVDRLALASGELLAATREAEYVAPRDELEEELTQLWAELLGIDRVGIEDDFFALGGHSLMATQVIARLRRTRGVDVPFQALFATPTVVGLAEAIRELQDASAEEEEVDTVLAELGVSAEEARELLVDADAER